LGIIDDEDARFFHCYPTSPSIIVSSSA
jgi:hypothetical protein